MSSFLDLPDLNESDPGKPIKASWGDRVVTAIQANCDRILGFGKANSVFDVFNGDGSDGNFDVTFSQSLAVPVAGLQFENLILRASVILALIRSMPYGSATDSQGVYKIGVSDTLTMEAGSIVHANAAGLFGGLGGAASAGFPSAANSGAPGDALTRYGLGQPSAGGGGGGAQANAPFGRSAGAGGSGGGILDAAGGSGGRAGFDGTAGVFGLPALSCRDGGAGAFSQINPTRMGLDLDLLCPGPGGGGGGAGSAGGFAGTNPGGDGGPGSGLVIFEVNKLNILAPSPSCQIQSNAGPGLAGGTAAGARPSGGGGGGGASGPIIVCFREQLALTFFPAFSVAGGAAGPGGITPVGPNACDGGVGRPGFVILRQV